MRMGLKLSNDLNDYTDAQIHFCLYCEEKQYADTVLPMDTPLTIHGDDEPETIINKFKGWVGRFRGNGKKADS